MGIDTSIYGQLRPLRIDSPFEVEAKAQQFRQMQQQNKLADLLYAEKQRTAEVDGKRRNTLMSAMNPETGDLDPAKYRSGLASIGDYEGLQSFQKTQAEQSKAQRESQKADLEMKLKRLEASAQIMAGVKDQASWESARQQAAQLFGPEAAAQLPEVYDPALIEQKRKQALPIQQQLEQQWKALNFKMDQDKFAYQQQNDTQNRNVTVRGQNMTDARSQQANSLKQQEIAAGGKPPAGYRWKQDGSGLEPIPGGPAEKDKAPTEFQGKSAGFGARADAADKIIRELEGKYSAAGVNTKQALGNIWGIGGALEAGANLALSPESQRAEQAQRDFINAVLRQESGAAIAESEFNNAKKQYFAQPGDSKDVIAQKARNRRLAVQGFLNNAGPAAKGATPPAQPQTIKFLGFE